MEIGSLEHELGHNESARDTLSKAIRLARSIRANGLAATAMQALAYVEYRSGKPFRALAHAQRALRTLEDVHADLDEASAAQSRQSRALLYEVGLTAALAEDELSEAFNFVESGRAGALRDSLSKREAMRWKAESLQADLKEAENSAVELLRTTRSAYDEAVQAKADRADIRAKRKAMVAAAQQLRDVTARVERELKQRSSLFYPRVKTIETVQTTIRPTHAFVLFSFSLDRLLAMVVRKSSARVVDLGEAASLRSLCASLDLRSPGSDPAPAIAALRKALIEPLGIDADVTTLLISPDGPLSYLPFSLLTDRFVAFTPSGTTHHTLCHQGCAHSGEGVLGLGDPDYGGQSALAKSLYYRGKALAPLPGSRREVEMIATRPLLGEAATEAGLRSALADRERWRAVHFACHGLIDPERPLLSALALTRTEGDDGFLTGREILQLDLRADLAVLSACESGTGKVVRGEGILGLTRAFMYAGSPRVLCSLWMVDDDATAALMVEFHRHWNANGAKRLGGRGGTCARPNNTCAAKRNGRTPSTGPLGRCGAFRSSAPRTRVAFLRRNAQALTPGFVRRGPRRVTSAWT